MEASNDGLRELLGNQFAEGREIEKYWELFQKVEAAYKETLGTALQSGRSGEMDGPGGA